MVAPIRTPQARGVKCDLCKKILTLATWLDQTKLAKNVEDAQTVLNLVGQHSKNECPCIPKNIENLLVGSTHFEIHRLIAKRLDNSVHKVQYEHSKTFQEQAKRQKATINDCPTSRHDSRFKMYACYNDKKHNELSKMQLKHLTMALDYWKTAMDDQANPFNTKLALRLGLTHHVVYSCYLFKYYKLLDYQLKSANLLLNLFKSIEGVTANAVLHAYYLVVKSLLDCAQINLARQYLKQATKSTNYHDKTNYESILLTCAFCELSLVENEDGHEVLDELARLVYIQPSDKLQHYYARTLAISIIIKYIHHYLARSDNCSEFFHAYRYASAIIRRCYESSFELVMLEKEVKQQNGQTEATSQDQMLDHSWIRFAICDFVFSIFDQLSNFYIRAGLPECLELLYNGLNLIAYRNGSHYWQTRMSIIGAKFDLLCDKHQHAESKLDSMSHIIGHTNNPNLMSLLRLDLEVNLLALLEHKQTAINHEVPMDLLQRIKTCKTSLLDKLAGIEFYDCKAGSHYKLERNLDDSNNLVVFGGHFGDLSLRTLKIATQTKLRSPDTSCAADLLIDLGTQLSGMSLRTLEYSECHVLLEILLSLAEVHKSEQILLDSTSLSSVFLTKESNLDTVSSQLSLLTINGNATKKRSTRAMSKITKLSMARHSKRRGSYNVACKLNETLRHFDIIEALKNFSSLTPEEMVVTYLRNSEPNPDYLLYRQAQELMICFRLKEENTNHDQLLYHFCESATSNTMRYRWMMYEEQQNSPYDQTTPIKCSSTNTRNLSFHNSPEDQEKVIKSWKRSMLDDLRLIQFKYIFCSKTLREHLLIVSYDSENIPIYAHVTNSLSEDEPTMPTKLATKIEEAKKTLFLSNQQTRSDTRQKLEIELGAILNDFENKWLGPFRFLLCSKITDLSYKNLVEKITEEILHINKEHICTSIGALKCMIENAALLSRGEFCQMISSIFNHAPGYNELRDSFNKWLKMIELHVAAKGRDSNKISFLQKLTRGQIGLILDKDLETIPFESLPIVRIQKQGMFRVPSLRLFNAIASRYCGMVKVDVDETIYILDPASNLAKTRERFEKKLRSHTCWHGVISCPPKTDDLEQWLREKEVYIFIGHGAGTAYYNKLCKGRGLSAMPSVKSLSIVMGCSSGRLLAEGPKLESFGISWVFILRGSPSYVGLLWDVTDTDIDRFLDSLLAKWMGPDWKEPTSGDDSNLCIPITDAVARVRHVCKLELLVGSTPVVYGLPVWCRTAPFEL